MIFLISGFTCTTSLICIPYRLSGLTVSGTNECPFCKTKIAPVYIASSLDSDNSVSIFDFSIITKTLSCQNIQFTKAAAAYQAPIITKQIY